MKVTKAKGLKTIWLADMAANHEGNLFDASRLWPRSHRARKPAMHPLPEALRVEPTPFRASSHFWLGQIVLSPFALATFIWGRK
jgi:hypothetical protein